MVYYFYSIIDVHVAGFDFLLRILVTSHTYISNAR